MQTHKRLFLVAGYDAHGAIDASCVYLVKSLSTYGDVIFCMDSDAPASELKKLTPYILHACAMRHGEYDFGSYKRAYTYARDNNLLGNYEFVYLINDSVYGPLHDIGPYLNTMENFNTDAFGLVEKLHYDHPHIQSWFIGCHKSVFLSNWFDEFITSVKSHTSKGTITALYEQGFTKRIISHKLTYKCIYAVRGRAVYNHVKSLYKRGLPFMKKMALSRHGGALGRQVQYVLHHTPDSIRVPIMENAIRTYGEKYMCWLLTRNPIKIMYRSIRYSISKLFGGKI